MAWNTAILSEELAKINQLSRQQAAVGMTPLSAEQTRGQVEGAVQAQYEPTMGMAKFEREADLRQQAINQQKYEFSEQMSQQKAATKRQAIKEGITGGIAGVTGIAAAGKKGYLGETVKGWMTPQKAGVSPTTLTNVSGPAMGGEAADVGGVAAEAAGGGYAAAALDTGIAAEAEMGGYAAAEGVVETGILTEVAPLAASNPYGWAALAILTVGTTLFSKDASVICTELHRQGYLTDETYVKDTWARQAFIPDNIYQNYLKLAAPIAVLMKRSKIATAIVKPFGLAGAHYLASMVDPSVKNSLFGKIVIHTGCAICKTIDTVRTEVCYG